MNARHVATILSALTLAACHHSSNNDPGPPFTAKIIAFNDFHGTLQSPGTFGVNTSVPAADRPAVGGAEFLAAHVAKLKSTNPLNVVVAAGDNIGASPLISALFSDEGTIEALNRVGLEFTSVGNHEFDKGSTELLRLQNGGCKTTNGQTDASSCKGATVGTPVPFEGAKFKWLSANVIQTSTGKPLLAPYGLKTFNGVQVAFIGMTLKDTPSIVTPTGVAGLEFRDEAQTVNALIPELKAQDVQAVVVLVHEGGFQTGSLSDINGCDGSLAGSAIAGIVSKLDNAVDLVVSAHTHIAYNCLLPNASGRMIPVTSASAFGRVLSDIDITIDPATKDITKVVATNRLVARNDPSVVANTAVQQIITAYNTLVSPISNQVIGAITASLPNTSDVACNMPAGLLIADAQLASTKPANLGGSVIAFMNAGGVRNPGLTFAQTVGEGDGNVTYGEAFTTQPFGNTLVSMTVTAQDIKNVLEQQFAGCRGQLATATRLMSPSAGFKYTWDGSKTCDARVSNVTLRANGATETIVDAGGTVVNPTKTYRITVNNFMSTGGDGFTTFINGKNFLGGAQDIDALTAYMAQYKSPNAPYAPNTAPDDAGTPRINRVGGGTACPGGANTNP
jgi:5'-nucleotidase